LVPRDADDRLLRTVEPQASIITASVPLCVVPAVVLGIKPPELLIRDLARTDPERLSDVDARLWSLVWLAATRAHHKLTRRNADNRHGHPLTEINEDLMRARRRLAFSRFRCIKGPPVGDNPLGLWQGQWPER
jgi:hypothetical protein